MALAWFSQSLPVSPAWSGKACSWFCLQCTSSCAVVRKMSMIWRLARFTSSVCISGVYLPKLLFCRLQSGSLCKTISGRSSMPKWSTTKSMNCRTLISFSSSGCSKNILVVGFTPSGLSLMKPYCTRGWGWASSARLSSRSLAALRASTRRLIYPLLRSNLNARLSAPNSPCCSSPDWRMARIFFINSLRRS